jgi:hypothetical protein
MGPQRLDHAELRQRLSGDVPGWVVDDLADSFEPAFLSFKRKADEAKKPKKPKKPEAAEAKRKARLGGQRDEADEGQGMG